MGLVWGFEEDKAETTAPAGVAIQNDFGVNDGADLRESFSELFIADAPCEVSHEEATTLVIRHVASGGKRTSGEGEKVNRAGHKRRGAWVSSWRRVPGGETVGGRAGEAAQNELGRCERVNKVRVCSPRARVFFLVDKCGHSEGVRAAAAGHASCKEWGGRVRRQRVVVGCVVRFVIHLEKIRSAA